MVMKLNLKMIVATLLLTLLSYSIVGIHHHHHDKVVPIIVELLAQCRNHTAEHSDPHANGCEHEDCHSISKCSAFQSALTNAKFSISKILSFIGVFYALYNSKDIILPICILIWNNEVTSSGCDVILCNNNFRAPPQYSFLENLIYSTKMNIENEIYKIYITRSCRFDGGL